MSKPAWTFDESNADVAGETSLSALYEYGPGAGGEPELVGVSGPAGSSDLIGACGVSIGSGGTGTEANFYNSLSADGRIVWFTVEPCATGTGTNAGVGSPVNGLFERIDGTHTIHVAAPTPSTCHEVACAQSRPSQALFEGASQDGRVALFTSTQKLTDDGSEDLNTGDRPTPGPATGCAHTSPLFSGCNLYESFCPAHCEDGSQRTLIDISAGAAATGGPRVQGVVALAPDGSSVYFVAKGVLPSAATASGAQAVEGGENLYLYRGDGDPSHGTLSFLATLSPADNELWAPGSPGQSSRAGMGLASLTPDGRFLLFPSRRGLTSDARPGDGPAQIYRFDADTGGIERVSIGQQGFGDDGNDGGPEAEATIPPASRAWAFDGPARPSLAISEDGRYAFFQSPVALTPGAVNEVVVEETASEVQRTKFYAQNIYEWEQDGAGGCDETGGCVSLLSNGTEEIGSGKIPTESPELLGTDASGENVFIAAKDPLTWQDTDTQRDYYDLRVGGGFAPPGEAQPCSGDGCRGAGSAAGTAGTPATSTTSGPEEGPRHPRKSKPKTCKKKKGKKGSTCHKQHKQKKHGKKNHGRHRGKPASKR
jgi:hypothetical protein